MFMVLLFALAVGYANGNQRVTERQFRTTENETQYIHSSHFW